MSVSSSQTPDSYTPCYNAQWFGAVSTLVANTNFRYTIVCTDVITSATATYQAEQRPDTRLVFDAANFAKNYMKHYIPNNAYGFQKCTDAIRKMRVNIGESYGTSTYASGTNVEYIVWNGVLKYLDFPSYDQTDYVYNANNENVVYLTNLYNRKTFIDKSLFLYALTSGQNDIGLIRIKTYNEADVLLGTYDISNPYSASTTYTDKYLAIDVGYKGLDNIASGLVTGGYPIISTNVAYYTVQDVSTLQVIPFQYSQITDLFRVDVQCEPRYDPYVLHFLDKQGNFDTMNFQKLSETNVQADKTYYRKNPYELNSNVWEYSIDTPNEQVLNSSTTTRLKLNCDWLTENEADVLRYIISSPVVYMDMGSTIGLIPVKVLTNQWLVNKNWNNKLYSVAIDIEYTHKDVFQNG